jgi:hypothetical protein
VFKYLAHILFALLILVASAGCAPGPPPTSYLGQKPPGTQPEIFAPGIVSTPGFTEWAGTFSPAGDEYYFWRTSDSEHRFLYTRLVNGSWTAPEDLPAVAEYWASEPHLTFDNTRLYFMWKHPAPPGPEGLPAYYFIERTPNGWSEPEYAGQGMFLSSSRDGQLYTTDMSLRLTSGATFLAKVTTDNGLFVKYERLNIPTYTGSQAHPCIAPDGSYILFDVHGGSYLFACFKEADGTWGEAIDLTRHGFNILAGGAYVSPDGKYLFFALNEDIWWVDSKVIEKLRPKE